jgi:UDP-glucuronate 4-epimerase
MAPYKFTEKILRGGEIEKYGAGNSKRDYTYIDDIVSGIIAALNKPSPFEIINLGNNNPVELNYFISVIEGLTGKNAKIKQLPEQQGDVPLTYADISKAQRLLGYDPKTTIEKGMKMFVSWYLAKRNK